MTPNDQQNAVRESEAHYNLVHGNAGSAKSTTLAMKVIDLLRSGQADVAQVLALTYSAPAVHAFRQRLRWLGLPAPQVQALRIQTFADFCQAQLQPLQGPCDHLVQPNRRVHDTVLQAIREARAQADERGQSEAFDIAGEGTLLVPSLLHHFRRLKGTLALKSLGNDFVLTRASARDAGLDFTQVAVLRAYERLRCAPVLAPGAWRDSDAPLFRLQDDPFYDMACVLTADDPPFDAGSHPLALDLRLLMVDEGHDLNRAMFTVLQHLVTANPRAQLFVVGDVDQVVHSDGGADETFMRDTFVRSIGPAKALHLTHCWRFGESLGTPLGRFAAKAYETDPHKPTAIRVVKVPDAGALARLIEGAYMEAASQERSPSLAVLLRHPGHAVELENALARLGFALDAHGFKPCLERAEVLFLRTLVAWATGELDTLANADLGALQDAMAEFTGCLGHEKARDVRFKSLQQFGTFFLGDVDAFLAGTDSSDAAPHITRADDKALAAMRHVVGALRAGREPAQPVPPAELPRIVREADFSPLARRALVFDEEVDEALSSVMAFARSAQSHDTLHGWLQQMSSREFDSRRRGGTPSRLLRAYTVTAAKGLEFDHVLIPGLESGEFSGAQREERNLFYVAASRARQQLTMTYSAQPSFYLGPFQETAVWDEVEAGDAAA